MSSYICSPTPSLLLIMINIPTWPNSTTVRVSMSVSYQLCRSLLVSLSTASNSRWSMLHVKKAKRVFESGDMKSRDGLMEVHGTNQPPAYVDLSVACGRFSHLRMCREEVDGMTVLQWSAFFDVIGPCLVGVIGECLNYTGNGREDNMWEIHNQRPSLIHQVRDSISTHRTWFITLNT